MKKAISILAIVVVMIVTLLNEVSAKDSFNWFMFLPAITNCDSYPFPNCKDRSSCQNDGQYWYNGKCNNEKHPDHVLLEKLNGYWNGIMGYKSKCGSYEYWGGDILFVFDKKMIGDDNSLVVPFEGTKFSITPTVQVIQPGAEPIIPNADVMYAVVSETGTEFAYTAKKINTKDDFSSYCLQDDGTFLLNFTITSGDTYVYYFNLPQVGRNIQGKVHYVKADLWFDLVSDFPENL